MKKNFVRIHSDVNITVTCGLNHLDVTNADAHIPDRLKVSPTWPTCTVQILKGSHVYPAEIAEWNTVKSLANDKFLSIGEFLEEADEQTVKAKEDLVETLKNIQTEEKPVTATPKKLSEIAGE